RITVRYHLSAMDFDDTKAYIEHRLVVAGGWRAATFAKGALKKIYASSGGIPRLINIICDRALLVGYTEESREISGPMAARAITEVREKRRGAISRIAWWAGAAALVAAVGGMLAAPREAPVRMPMPKARQTSRVNAAPVKEASADAPLVIRRELATTEEGESAANAFNALLKLWGLPALSGPVQVHGPHDLDRLAEGRGLTLVRLSWSLDRVLKADSPALLEINLPGITGKRYLALIGRDKERLLFAPPLKGCDSVSSAGLRGIWSGRAYLPWRNYRNIPLLGPGMKGQGVNSLQQLLAGAGVYHEEPTGVFDKETIAAIRTFQAREGITQSGKPGKQTLFFLYRRNSGYSAPRLELTGGERKV
ncbi:MAG TPA: peptidoglycan-binding protein, partial [Geobacteraceae bacterium]